MFKHPTPTCNVLFMLYQLVSILISKVKVWNIVNQKLCEFIELRYNKVYKRMKVKND